jgi:hypothetical protein
MPQIGLPHYRLASFKPAQRSAGLPSAQRRANFGLEPLMRRIRYGPSWADGAYQLGGLCHVDLFSRARRPQLKIVANYAVGPHPRGHRRPDRQARDDTRSAWLLHLSTASCESQEWESTQSAVSGPARPSQNVRPGQGLPVRLSPTVPDTRNRPGLP